jgi:hypothetical protein
MSLTVNTTRYELANGKKPRGYDDGQWAFFFDGETDVKGPMVHRQVQRGKGYGGCLCGHPQALHDRTRIVISKLNDNSHLEMQGLNRASCSPHRCAPAPADPAFWPPSPTERPNSVTR